MPANLKQLYLIMGCFVAAALFVAGCGSRDSGGGPAETAPEPEKEHPESTAELILRGDTVVPGGYLPGEVVLAVPDGWHTYSDPPGDSGMAPIVEFDVPDGWAAERLPLPKPMRFEDESGVTFGYENRLAIEFRLRSPETAAPGTEADIAVSVQWLTCKEICLPWSARLDARVAVVEDNDPSPKE
jgi:thiol:disulfide interchange protein DsbD